MAGSLRDRGAVRRRVCTLYCAAVGAVVGGEARAEPAAGEPGPPTAGITLYGTVDLGVAHFTGVRAERLPRTGNPPVRSLTALGSGFNQGSALGLRGVERLGARTRAMFHIETAFCAAGLNQFNANGDRFCGGGGLMQNKTYVGLGGDWGEVRVGRQPSLQDDMQGVADPFAGGLTGQFGNLSLHGRNRPGMDFGKLDQSVGYFGPRLPGGIRLAAQYAFDAASLPGPVPGRLRVRTVDAHVESGPWLGGANFARWDHPLPGRSDPSSGGYSLLGLYGAWDAGSVRLSGLWQRGCASGHGGRQHAWVFGARLPCGAGTLVASVAGYSGSLGPGSAALETSRANQWAVGYRHALSRRTTLYTSYAVIGNDSPGPGRDGTALGVGAAGEDFAGTPGRRSSGFAMGMTHIF